MPAARSGLGEATIEAAELLSAPDDGTFVHAPCQRCTNPRVRGVLWLLMAIVGAWQVARDSAQLGFGSGSSGRRLEALLLGPDWKQQVQSAVGEDPADWPHGRELVDSAAAVRKHVHTVLASYFSVAERSASRIDALPSALPVSLSWSRLSVACRDAFRATLAGRTVSLTGCAGEQALTSTSATCNSMATCGTSTAAALANGSLPSRSLELSLPLAVHDPWPDTHPLWPHACLLWRLRLAYSLRGALAEVTATAAPVGACPVGGVKVQPSGWALGAAGATVAVCLAFAGVTIGWIAVVVWRRARLRSLLGEESGSSEGGGGGGGGDSGGGAGATRALEMPLLGTGPHAIRGVERAALNTEATAMFEDDFRAETEAGLAVGVLAELEERWWRLVRPWGAVGAVGAALLTVRACFTLAAPLDAGFSLGSSLPALALAAGNALVWLSALDLCVDSPAAGVVVQTVGESAVPAALLLIGILPIVAGFACFALGALAFAPRFATVMDTAVTLFAVVNGDAMLETFQHLRPAGREALHWLTDLWLVVYVVVCLVAALKALVAVTERAFFSARAALQGGSKARAQAQARYRPVMLRALLQRISERRAGSLAPSARVLAGGGLRRSLSVGAVAQALRRRTPLLESASSINDLGGDTTA